MSYVSRNQQLKRGSGTSSGGESKWKQQPHQLNNFDVTSKHDAYLERLEEQTRAKRQLAAQKSAGNKVVDEKEQGFLLYVNGANSGRPKHSQVATGRVTSATGTRKSQHVSAAPIPSSELSISTSIPRARTAPAKRRKWGQDSSIEIITHREGKMKFSESMFQHKYSDNFESDGSSDEGEDEGVAASGGSHEDEEEEIPDETVVSFNKQEVSLLRQSLKLGGTLRESIREELGAGSSSNDEEDISDHREDVTLTFDQKNNQKSVRTLKSKPYKPSGAFRTTPEPSASLFESFLFETTVKSNQPHDQKIDTTDLGITQIFNSTSKPKPVKTRQPSDIVVSNSQQSPENTFEKFTKRSTDFEHGRTLRQSGDKAVDRSSDMDFVVQKFRNLDIEQKRALLEALNAESNMGVSPISIPHPQSSPDFSEDQILSSEEEAVGDSSNMAASACDSSIDAGKSLESSDAAARRVLPTYRVDKVSKSFTKQSNSLDDNVGTDETLIARNVATSNTEGAIGRADAPTGSGGYVCMQSSPQHLSRIDSSKVISPQSSQINFQQNPIRNIILLKLLSNWGDPNIIGITEVEFLDLNGIKIKCERVSVMNAIDQSSSIATVINGKFKTTRASNMWSCVFTQNATPVEMYFTLPVKQIAHKVKIWNYNRSPRDLNKGARQAVLQVNKDVVWCGELEKGCGSQIFDYEQVVFLESFQGKSALATNRSFVVNESSVPSGMNLPNADDPRAVVSPLHIFSSPSLGDFDDCDSGSDLKADVKDSKLQSSSLTKCSYSESSPTASASNTLVEQDVKNDIGDTSFSLEELLGGIQPRKAQSVSTGRKVANISGIFDSLDLGTNEEVHHIQDAHSGNVNPELVGTNAKLDESWSHIFAFEKSRMGQLNGANKNLDVILSQPSTPGDKSSRSESRKNSDTPDYLSTPRSATSHAKCNTVIDDDDFDIPELPVGGRLTINILSTWGDKHYVGLNGIEVYDKRGFPVTVNRIFANPSDINVLPEYSKDPRVVKNLVDGVNNTRDDTHMWLAPFTSTKDHFVFVEFAETCSVAMIRLWNYNKSRVHSSRGARAVVISLDDQVIFKGEIQRAGEMGENMTETFGDTIMFTMDESILYAISVNDELFLNEYDETLSESEDQRPSTADDSEHAGNRPFTVASNVKPNNSLLLSQSMDLTNVKSVRGRTIVLNFTETWSDAYYIGLTGLELLDGSGEPISITADMIDANPRDCNTLSTSNGADVRTVDKLVDGVNDGTEDKHMWLVPFTQGANHTVTISLPISPPGGITGLRIWNYNKSWEDTFRGAKRMHVSIDKKTVSPEPDGFLLRKAPGHTNYNSAQTLIFNATGSTWVSPESEDTPCGFVYSIMLHSSHGDPYYVGLDGIQFLDANKQPIYLNESQVDACPRSVNDLQGVTNDVRTTEKLIDGVNFGKDGTHSWLAPIFPGVKNKIYILFDYPQVVTAIRIWNYSKTPTRGANEVSILVDDIIRYQGVLKPSLNAARGIIPGLDETPQHQTINLVMEAGGVTEHGDHASANEVTDNVKVHDTASSASSANQTKRPKTCVPKKR